MALGFERFYYLTILKLYQGLTTKGNGDC